MLYVLRSYDPPVYTRHFKKICFPFTRWLKNGQPIEAEIGYKILLNGRKLLISRVEVSDTGHYQCIATNKAGDHKKEFEVTVHGVLYLQGGKEGMGLALGLFSQINILQPVTVNTWMS